MTTETRSMTEREEERAAIVALVRRDCGMEAVRLALAVALPGGTARSRLKAKSFAEGMAYGIEFAANAIERAAHATPPLTPKATLHD